MMTTDAWTKVRSAPWRMGTSKPWVSSFSRYGPGRPRRSTSASTVVIGTTMSWSPVAVLDATPLKASEASKCVSPTASPAAASTIVDRGRGRRRGVPARLRARAACASMSRKRASGYHCLRHGRPATVGGSDVDDGGHRMSRSQALQGGRHRRPVVGARRSRSRPCAPGTSARISRPWRLQPVATPAP